MALDGEYQLAQPFVLLENERVKVEVKEFGKRVWIPNTIFHRANHYIETSREYVGDRKLTRYAYFSGLQWIYVIFVVLGLISPAHYIFAFIMAFCHFLWIFLWSQYMYVNIKTMPAVLSQIVVPNTVQDEHNNFYEISLEKFQLRFAAYQNAGIGIVQREKGTIQFQVFNWTARGKMRSSIAVSTLAFLMAGFMIVYCIGLGIYRAIQLT